MVTRWLALAVVAVVAAAATASADPSGDNPDTSRAKTHYRQGKAFLDSGLYDDAIREFQAAYQISPVAELLFNIAQADRLKGDSEKALAMYQKYVEEAPDGPGADEAHGHIAALTKLLREHKIEPPRPPRPPTEDDTEPHVDQPPPPPAQPPQPPPRPPSDDDRELRMHHRAIGRYLVYGSIGLELVAGAFMYFGADLDNQIRSKTFNTGADLRSAASLGTIYNWTAIIAGGLGAAGIATGITLIVRNGDVQDVRVTATASSDFTGLVLSGRM